MRRVGGRWEEGGVRRREGGIDGEKGHRREGGRRDL